MLNNDQLDNYRILHFATHGLVTAPRPDCPPRPALVTSFGGPGSDGLLSFREIFDLKLDADVVILSACDTAGAASASASREAGIMTGGNYALDGLVRAFIGAGARSVIASHWPVPDNYNATNRLISGLIEAKPGQPLADALGGRAARADGRPRHVASHSIGRRSSFSATGPSHWSAALRRQSPAAERGYNTARWRLSKVCA